MESKDNVNSGHPDSIFHYIDRSINMCVKQSVQNTALSKSFTLHDNLVGGWMRVMPILDVSQTRSNKMKTSDPDNTITQCYFLTSFWPVEATWAHYNQTSLE